MNTDTNTNTSTNTDDNTNTKKVGGCPGWEKFDCFQADLDGDLMNTDTNTKTNTVTNTDRNTNTENGRGMPWMGTILAQFPVVKLISTGAFSHEGAVPNNGLQAMTSSKGSVLCIVRSCLVRIFVI